MKLTIRWTYKNKDVEVEFISDELTPQQALIIVEDLQNSNRTKSIDISDEHNSTWSLKSLKKYLKEMETAPNNVIVYFDGGFDLQSQEVGLGCVIYFEQNGKKYRLRRNAKINYLSSNNEAEYAALKFAIDELQGLDVHHQTVQFIGDSQVVINQMAGDWPVYEKYLSKWADVIDEKLQNLEITPEFKQVPREENQEADSLATQALKDIEITAKIEIN